MPDIVRRGYVPTDEIEFNDENIEILKIAQKDIFMLINRGYGIDKCTEFVGNHFMLSERQRTALKRATASESDLKKRNSTLIENLPEASTVNIDGLNLIITLEVAISNCTILKCMDKTIRDLAGLRGTYKIVDKTIQSLELIGRKLESIKISKAVFYLDSPVSNTGRLKQKIFEMLENYRFNIEVNLVNNADVILEKLENVITTDAIILNRCTSWLNTAYEIVDSYIPDKKYVDLSAWN